MEVTFLNLHMQKHCVTSVPLTKVDDTDTHASGTSTVRK